MSARGSARTPNQDQVRRSGKATTPANGVWRRGEPASVTDVETAEMEYAPSSTRLTAYDVMTAREVAVLLHAPVSTVEDWARRGILPSRKIGKRRLYIRQQIEAVLTGGS